LQVLGGCGAQLTSLQAVSLAGCHLGPQGLAALTAALARHPPAALTCLGLADNKLGAAGLQHLAKALSSSSARLGSSLTCLDLSLNDIGTDGCRQLAQLCGALPSLGELSLAANSIRAEGMQALAPQLQELAALSALRLHGNALGDAGFGALAAALPGLPLLAELQLQENQGVGAEGVWLLASALAACESLTSLDLSKTGIGVEGGKQLGALLQVCSASCHTCL
jgi:Ran GTPase-activating protein (RanGAP) involved in mRNA processing and transport